MIATKQDRDAAEQERPKEYDPEQTIGVEKQIVARSAALIANNRDRDAVSQATRFGPQVVELVEQLKSEGVTEQELNEFLTQMTAGVGAAPAIQSGLAGARRVRALGKEGVHVTLPGGHTLSGWQARLLLGAVGNVLGGRGGAALLNTLPEIANTFNATIGIGPSVSGGLGSGAGLGAGIVFAPGHVVGFYGSVAAAMGAIESISATLQITIVRGGLENFTGDAVAVTVAGGEEVVGSASALFNPAGEFLGISSEIGVGGGAPMEFYMQIQKTWATPQSLGTGGRLGTQALAGESFDINWNDVQLMPQLTKMSCWAAAGAMVVGWRDRISISETEVAKGAGQWARYKNLFGLEFDKTDDFGRAWDLEVEPPQSYTIDAFRVMLEAKGPLWMHAVVPGHHAIVITGMYSDGNPDGSDTYVRVLDPWGRAPGGAAAPGPYNPTPGQGSRYTLSWADFQSEYEGAVSTDASGTVNAAQILHAGGTGGRMIDVGPGLDHPMSLARPVSRPMAVVEIASAIIGAVMSRILDNKGDVHWELDKLNGMKHVRDNPENSGGNVRDGSLVLDGPRAWRGVRPIEDQIYADFRVDYQYDGRSVGNVVVTPVKINDAVAAGLTVKARIINDAVTYRNPSTGETCAAIKLQFHYRFDTTVGDDAIAETMVKLYGNGSVDKVFKWHQRW